MFDSGTVSVSHIVILVFDSISCSPVSEAVYPKSRLLKLANY